jgi:anti-anti-sigma factor
MSHAVVFAREPFAALASPGSRPDAANAAVLNVVGELDLAAVPELDYELRRAEARATVVVVDLRELEFIDTSGACLLLEAHRRIRSAGGQMLVVRGSAEVEWFLALIGIDRELELVDWPRVGHAAPRVRRAVDAGSRRRRASGRLQRAAGRR